MSPVFAIDYPVLPIIGSEQVYPVRRIFCVARNYAEHAREMGDSGREAPFFFMKPASAVLSAPANTPIAMRYPSRCADLHHEIELVIALGAAGATTAIRDIEPQEAHAHIFAYGVGLDMTRRDVQAELKKLGRPWELAKGFDESAPISALQPAARIGHPLQGTITLAVNQQLRQKGDLRDMIWPAADLVSILSQWFTLLPGDLIFTGTPAGVGTVTRGDSLHGEIAGVGTLSVQII